MYANLHYLKKILQLRDNFQTSGTYKRQNSSHYLHTLLKDAFIANRAEELHFPRPFPSLLSH